VVHHGGRGGAPAARAAGPVTEVLHVVGARPNFPKLAPVYHALARAGAAQRVVHTGQHYDDLLSDNFFRLLELPEPHVNLGVGSATHAVQTARIMERIEPVLADLRPRWVVVYGDVNSTAAAALVAVKLGIRVAHVEAGLRSFDRTMPEEINRVVTDRLSDLLLTPSRDADQQLRREGEPDEEIAFVGNVMIDSLCRALPSADPAAAAARYGVGPDAAIVTLHRPSNVDDPGRLRRLAAALAAIARRRPVFFPAHPRTATAIHALGIDFGRAVVHPPVPYLDMLALVRTAGVVITDSGGLQEETTVLGVPCLTVRANTERPITIAEGTNRLVPEPEALPEAAAAARRPQVVPVIEGWDGAAGSRAAKEILGRIG
jgi:UDP-N-acetylglucosamine 2-epimerase (non-hydrolysing)